MSNINMIMRTSLKNFNLCQILIRHKISAYEHKINFTQKNEISNFQKIYRPVTLPISSSRCYSQDSTSKLLPDIDFEELQEKIKTPEIILLDVRTPQEFETEGFIPGSTNIPLMHLGNMILMSNEEFKSTVGIDKPSQDAKVITTCLKGIRARTAQLALVGAGYKDVRTYAGSFEDWKEKGGQIDRLSA